MYHNMNVEVKGQDFGVGTLLVLGDLTQLSALAISIVAHGAFSPTVFSFVSISFQTHKSRGLKVGRALRHHLGPNLYSTNG